MYVRMESSYICMCIWVCRQRRTGAGVGHACTYVYLGVRSGGGRGGRASMYVSLSGCAAAEADAVAGHACMYVGVPRRAGAGAGHARVFLTVSYKTGARAWAGQWAKW